MENNYGEQILSAVDILVSKRIKEIRNDSTINCSIEDDTNAESGEYVVNSGSASFTAYSSNETKYKKKDLVYVTIPQGDYNEKKFIIGKAEKQDAISRRYERPFDKATFLVLGQFAGKGTIYANVTDKSEVSLLDKPLLFSNTIGYNYLGIRFNLNAKLENATKGSYGIKILINGNELVYFDSSEFLGNLYIFPIALTLEKIFKVSDDFNIEKVELTAYQNNDFNENEYPLETSAEATDLSEREISFSKVEVFLGIESSEAVDGLMLTSNESVPYTSAESRRVISRMIINHKVVKPNTLEWYYYKVGAPAPNDYIGINWVKLKTSELDIYFQINNNINYNRLRAVATYNNLRYFSSILVFTKSNLIASLTNENNNTLVCLDGSDGNYYCYSAGNVLTNPIHKLDKILLYGNEMIRLGEGDKITWYVPKRSMIQVAEEGKTSNYLPIAVTEEAYNNLPITYYYHNDETDLYIQCTEEDPFTNRDYYIEDPNFNKVVKTAGEDAILTYTIGNNFINRNTNNVIKCQLIKGGLTFNAIKQFNFGLAGTTGTEMTLILNQNAPIVPAIEDSSCIVTARIYGFDNEELEIPDNWDFEWSWYSSNAQVENLDVWYKKAGLEEPLSREEELYYETSGSGKNICIILRYDGITPSNLFKTSYILKCSVVDSNTKKVIMESICPIIIAAKTDYTMVGPSFITYDTEGHVAFNDDSSYKILQEPDAIGGIYSYLGNDIKDEYSKINSTVGTLIDRAILLYLPTFTTSSSRINMPLIYSEDAPTFSVVFRNNDGEIIFTLPIAVILNKYFSTTLNQWSGNSMEFEDGKILTNAIAAGKKNSDDNTFSGVIIGDWQEKDNVLDALSKQTGVYGFHRGAMSYAFKEDGTAFIGAAGRGRIVFDGNDAIIQSAYWNDTGGHGMAIKLSVPSIQMKEGITYIEAKDITTEEKYLNAVEKGELYIRIGNGYERVESNTPYDPNTTYYRISSDGYINIDASQTIYPLSIGTNSNIEKLAFRISWDGTAYLEKILATGGAIAGWNVEKNTLYSENVLGGTTNRIELNSSNSLENFGIHLRGPQAVIHIEDENGTLYGELSYVPSSTGAEEDLGIGFNGEPHINDKGERDHLYLFLVSKISVGMKDIIKNHYFALTENGFGMSFKDCAELRLNGSGARLVGRQGHPVTLEGQNENDVTKHYIEVNKDGAWYDGNEILTKADLETFAVKNNLII